MLIAPSALPAVPLTLSQPSPEQERILSRCDSLFHAGGPRARLGSLLDSCLAVARAGGDSAWWLPLVLRRGLYLARNGEAAAALPHLRRAMALAEARKDSLALAGALRYLGLCLGERGRWEEAVQTFRRQLAVAATSGRQDAAGWARVGLAWVAGQEGRTAEMARQYRRAIALFREAAAPRGEAWARNGLGIALQWQGEFDAARTCYRRTVRWARAHRDTLLLALALNNLGTLDFSLDDPALAVGRFVEAAGLQESLGQHREPLTPLLNAALCHASLEDWDRAEELDRVVLQRADREGYPDLAATALLQLAELASRQGESQTAVRRYREVLERVRGVSRKTRLEAGMGLAREYLDRHEPAMAGTLLDSLAEELLPPGGFPEHRCSWMILRGEIQLALGFPAVAESTLLAAEALAARHSLDVERIRPAYLAARAAEKDDRPDSAAARLTRAVAAWERSRDIPSDPRWREQRGGAGRDLYPALARLLLAGRCGTGDLTPAQRVRVAWQRLQAFKARTLRERMLGRRVRRLASRAYAAGTHVVA